MSRDLLDNATPRPWAWLRSDVPPAPGFRFGGRGEMNESGYCMSTQDVELLVAAVNEYEALLAVADAAGSLARLPYPVSTDERTEWLTYQQHLVDTLARLDALRSQS